MMSEAGVDEVSIGEQVNRIVNEWEPDKVILFFFKGAEVRALSNLPGSGIKELLMEAMVSWQRRDMNLTEEQREALKRKYGGAGDGDDASDAGRR